MDSCLRRNDGNIQQGQSAAAALGVVAALSERLHGRHGCHFAVILAKAGIHLRARTKHRWGWIPACAGMTVKGAGMKAGY